MHYAISILETVYLIPAKFVKEFVGTDFFELRVFVDNKIRVILFTVNDDNINLATNVLLLNGFGKKNTKDYDKGITKPINILRSVLWQQRIID